MEERPAKRLPSVGTGLEVRGQKSFASNLKRSDPQTFNLNTMRHVITLLVENEFGVLARVAGLFSGRGFNIESLSVAETLDPTVSTMTIVTRGDDQIIEQVTKQLNKLVCVIKVVDLAEKDFVEREMVLVKVSATAETREEILRIADIFRGKVIDVGSKTYTIEVTGDEKKIDALLALLKPLGIKELVRTGHVAMIRGSKITTEPS
jgi:acetolactate synthase-1/3 small subunit